MHSLCPNYVHLHEVLAYCCTLKIFMSILFFCERFFLFDKLILVNEARTSCKWVESARWTRVIRHCQNPLNNIKGFLKKQSKRPPF